MAFEQQFTVLTFECDPWGRMTPGAALRRIQEISIAQCDAIGLTDAVYRQHGCIFLLSRMSFKVLSRMPQKGEAVRIQTRPYAAVRAQYLRATTLYAQSGEPLCEADTRWVLVGTAEKRILRRPPEGFVVPFLDEPEEGHEMKLPKPGALTQVAEGVAAYSMCDTNGHMNNTRYADMVCDALPLDGLAAGPVKRLLLNYHAEIPLGATFVLLKAAGEGGTSFVATSNGYKNFEAWAEL